MDAHLVALASPFFVILIIIEYYFSKYKKTSLYQFNDSINNLSTGILEEIGSLPFKALFIYVYYLLSQNYAFFHFRSDSILTWILLWISVDFCYYWFHRISHRNSFFWIGHSVHHQSEEYNLSVALRQGYLQTMVSWIFYLPLALLGFSTTMFVIVSALNTIYQFWIHTKTIHKMGWLEHIINTPSHHRVHHGRNPQYIDKNYAGSLIIWDKLFGTFEPEDAPVEYGVTDPLDTWNPFTANIKVIQDLLYYGNSLKNKWNIARAFFMPPEWITRQLEKEKTRVAKRIIPQKNKDSPKIYMLFNLILATALYTYLSFMFNKDFLFSWLIIAFILITLFGLGHIANGFKKIQILELLRAFCVIISVYLLVNNLLFAVGIGFLFFAINHLLLHYKQIKTLITSIYATAR